MAETLYNLAAQDIIDSRDIVERMEELQDELNDLQQAVEDARTLLNGCEEEDKHTLQESLSDALHDVVEWRTSNDDELRDLVKLDSEGRDASSDWENGETPVRESYFIDYAQELAEECGMVSRNVEWPLRCIDWQKAADELKDDYTTPTVDGTEYFIRAS